MAKVFIYYEKKIFTIITVNIITANQNHLISVHFSLLFILILFLISFIIKFPLKLLHMDHGLL